MCFIKQRSSLQTNGLQSATNWNEIRSVYDVTGHLTQVEVRVCTDISCPLLLRIEQLLRLNVHQVHI